MKSIKKNIVTEWPTLISCGILRNEIKQIIAKHNWPIKTRFLDSSLHIDLEKLSKVLTAALADSAASKLVVYGTCHPKIDDMLSANNAIRVPCQNCVELVLGRERFSKELEKGAFFLFEDWARRWDQISYRYFGNWEIMREIFKDAHQYILCIRTPCSGDFAEHAHQVSQRTGLPLFWEDFSLSHLESVLNDSLYKFIKERDHV
ncbi:MAG: DUF1638 domain-containing protein [Desulfamplus sp.]|nr:DUF1638 domain-containing protein [Desulfamplus sp.]